MAFTGNFMCTSFKVEILSAHHNFNTTNPAKSANTQDTFYMALYTSSATLTAATTAYTTSGAVVVANGAGYSGDQFLVRLIDVKDTQDWGILYFYYELVKID